MHDNSRDRGNDQSSQYARLIKVDQAHYSASFKRFTPKGAQELAANHSSDLAHG
jgi:hypothetical protein